MKFSKLTPQQRDIAIGVDEGMTRFVGIVFLWGALLYLLLTIASPFLFNWLLPRDSTDAPTGPRSGMIILTDALSGCEYLSTPAGGLTPRVDATGAQLCGSK